MVNVEFFDDLDALERDAAGALDRQLQPSLYDSLPWLRLTRDHVLSQVQFCAARARDGDGRTAWLFLRHDGGGRAEAFATWYTLAFAPVFSDVAVATNVRELDARAPLIAALAKLLRTRFQHIELTPMDDGRGQVSLLRQAFAASGWLARQSVATYSWIAKTDEHPFATYWDRRPTRLRNTVERQRRRADLDIAVLEHFDEQAWSEYRAVYEKSWKPAEGSPAFMRAFAEQAGRWGSLRLGSARRNGRAVAAQLWTVDRGVATIHKLAHDEAAKAHSPGTLLTAAMFEHVLDRDRPMVVDFGTGDDSYKADWMDQKRPLYRLALYNLRSTGGIAAAGRASARSLVDRLRNL